MKMGFPGRGDQFTNSGGKPADEASRVVCDPDFGVARAHAPLADEGCRYIYNVRDFPRSLRLAYGLLCRRHHEQRRLLYETAAHRGIWDNALGCEQVAAATTLRPKPLFIEPQDIRI